MKQIMLATLILAGWICGPLFHGATAHGDEDHGMVESSEMTAEAETAEETEVAAEGPVVEGEDEVEAPVKVGNTLCPVSGEPVGSMGDPVLVEHEGKIYNLCCAMCRGEFFKNPEKYSKIAEEEAAEASEL